MERYPTLGEFLSESYYVPLLLLVLCITTAALGCLNMSKFKHLRLFILYALAAAAQIIFCFYCLLFRVSAAEILSNYSSTAFVIVEVYIFYNLLFKILRSKYLKHLMQIVQGMFLLIGVLVCLTMPTLGSIPLSFNILNSIVLLIPCLFFFFETFKSDPSHSLPKQPEFWIITAFGFMTICTLPFYLIEKYFLTNSSNMYTQVSALNYFFYCLLFLLISKAFLCKPI